MTHEMNSLQWSARRCLLRRTGLCSVSTTGEYNWAAKGMSTLPHNRQNQQLRLDAVPAELGCRLLTNEDDLVTMCIPAVWVQAPKVEAGPAVQFCVGESDAVHTEPQRRGRPVLDVVPAVVAVVQHEGLSVLDHEVTARG